MGIKKYRIILINIIVFVVIVSIIAVVYTMDIKKKSLNNSNSTAAMYFIKDYNGRVAVFKPNEDTPMRILNVYTSTLPSADRIMLEEEDGLAVQDESKLNSIIEDFDS